MKKRAGVHAGRKPSTEKPLARGARYALTSFGDSALLEEFSSERDNLRDSLRKQAKFTEHEQALLQAWDACNRPHIDAALMLRVLDSAREAEQTLYQGDRDALLAPQVSDVSEDTIAVAMETDAEEACQRVEASEDDGGAMEAPSNLSGRGPLTLPRSK